MTASDRLTYAAAGLLLVLGVYAYRKGATFAGQLAGDALKTARGIGTAINPASRDNVVYQGANAVLSAATGQDTTVGTTLADFFPSAAERQVNAIFGGQGAAPGNAPAQSRSLFNFWDSGEPNTDAFAPPGFLGTLPADASQPAIIYRTGKRA